MAQSIRSQINHLSKCQRDMLLRHACGPQPIINNGARRADYLTRRALFSQQMIRYAGGIIAPKFSELTPLGQEVVCILLGCSADALVRLESLKETLNTPPQFLPVVALEMSRKEDQCDASEISATFREKIEAGERLLLL